MADASNIRCSSIPALLAVKASRSDQIRKALQRSNENATGGYLDQHGPNELLVRAPRTHSDRRVIYRKSSLDREGRPIALAQVAGIVEAPQAKRGDSGAYRRNADGEFTGGASVVFTIAKQPGADTRLITERI